MTSLNYDNFLNAIMDEVKASLPSSYSLNLHHVVKNNNTELDGLLIRKENESIIPSIYLNEYFNDYQKGRSLDNIKDDIWMQYTRIKGFCKSDYDISDVFKNAHNKVFAKLVNYEQNKEHLNNVPFTLFEDLAVTYHLSVDDPQGYGASIKVTNDNLKMLNLDSSMLHELAINNTLKLFPPIIKSLDEILCDYVDENMLRPTNEHSTDMLVLTNDYCIDGAICMLYPNLLDSLYDKFGCDFFILPSSTNEVLLLPLNLEMDIDKLNDLVKEVNSTQVPPENILSDHAYLYSQIKDSLDSLGLVTCY